MATEILQKLNDNTVYLAYITLDRMMQYEEFMEFVEQNGLMVYGCVAIADKETILQMNENAAVYEIYVEELR